MRSQFLILSRGRGIAGRNVRLRSQSHWAGLILLGCWLVVAVRLDCQGEPASGGGTDRQIAAKSADSTATTTGKKSVKSTALFMGWENIVKGRMQPRIDPSRVTPEGQKVIEGLQQSWNIAFKTNGHGLEPYQTPRGIRITLEKARKSAPWLVADRPWEDIIYWFSVFREKGLLRCWYIFKPASQRLEYGFQDGRAIETAGTGLAYAESDDGAHWVKPNLGICPFNGSKENNIASYENFCAGIFRDDHGLVEERYKSFEFGKLPPEELAGKTGSFNSYCLYALVSPDSFHWKKLPQPLVRHFCDTQNIAAWDPVSKKYVGYFRDHQGGRAISRSETDDFHSWPPPQPLLGPGPEDGPAADIYNNCYTTYPGEPTRRLLFPSMYHQDTDRVDVRLASSTEGRLYNWVSHEPIIELGAPGQFDSAQIYASPDMVRLPDGKLALGYLGYATTHNEAFFPSFYRDFSTPGKCAWALWDDGRLAGVEAASDGEFYTPPFHPEGDQIEINARTDSGGRIVFEIIQDGKPLQGYAQTENLPVTGDKLWTTLQWNGKADLAELRGKKLQLHVLLIRAKVFGYRVVTAAKVSERPPSGQPVHR